MFRSVTFDLYLCLCIPHPVTTTELMFKSIPSLNVQSNFSFHKEKQKRWISIFTGHSEGIQGEHHDLKNQH